MADDKGSVLNYPRGMYAAYDLGPEPEYNTDDPQYQLEPDEKEALISLVRSATARESAPRRQEVIQAWKARLFDRGYQYLSPNRDGGWGLGTGRLDKGGYEAWRTRNGRYAFNIFSSQKDIIVSALTREVPKVQFFPETPDDQADVIAAMAANSYKHSWSKVSDLQSRIVEISGYFYTDGRAVMYTRSVADAQRFGVDDQEEPYIPEEGAVDPGSSQAGLQDKLPESVTSYSPRVREISTVYGKLENKLPLAAQYISEMPYMQLSWEVDEVAAKAQYPWCADQIKPGTFGETAQFDRIARQNCRLNYGGNALLGNDNEGHDATICYTWLRPAMFMHESARQFRDSFIQKFPDGVLVQMAGDTLASARNERMDDHLSVMHPVPGSGQNRRALGTAMIDTQEMFNEMLNLNYQFQKRSIPHRYYDDQAFDIEAIAQQENGVGVAHPFRRQPGAATSELVFVEPVIPQQPGMLELTQWMSQGLPVTLTGAEPSLFGGASNTDTVGGIQIQRDQALQRIGMSRFAIRAGMAEAAQHATQSAAANRSGRIEETVPGGGRVALEISDLRGNTLCYPETDSGFPQTGAEKRAQMMELVEAAGTNPVIGAIMQQPKNMKVAKDLIGLCDMDIPGASSVEKQEGETEEMLKTSPQPNPAYEQALQMVQQAPQEIAEMEAQGQDPSQAVQMVQQLQQQLQGMPQQVSSIEVAQDASEDHQVEAATCFEWMNSIAGREYKYGTDEQRAGFANVKLHWQEHNAQVKAMHNPTPEQPRINVNVAIDKLPPEVQAQMLAFMGIQSSPEDFATNSQQPHEAVTEVEQEGPFGKVKHTVSTAGKPLN